MPDFAHSVDPDQIKITRLFPTPLASIVHPDHVQLNAALRQVILQHSVEHPGTRHSNDGGWQSQDNFPEWAGEPGRQLLAFAQELANQVSAVNSPEHGLIEARLTWNYSAWANINHKGHSNTLHGHPGSYWSAVYWVDDGGREDDVSVGGDLEFLDPRGIAPTLLNPALRMRIEGCLGAGYLETVTPRSGTLLMFPSWLMHAVRRYEGDRPRISVAFNFSI
ncbi:MAG: TIGR02466 family protein [Pseudomonas sp.]|uniref:TIGR02466 family protein n=1 Tax=Pseudomonas abieticivorans TaxID=2931382 RepID=UPI0020BE2960|nr:TIGR02466 family protein [Pseudomonas sp. PIA16]MDE1167944.1 TIGR02466 family protein [Pseudomonas sp.]